MLFFLTFHKQLFLVTAASPSLPLPAVRLRLPA